MMKLVAPPEIGHFEIDNIEYRPNSDGVIEVQLAAHEQAMRRLGAVEYDPDVPTDELFNPKADERLQSDFDAEMAAKDKELAAANEANATLHQRLEALEKAMAAAKAPAVPPKPVAAPEDTSEKAGDTTATDNEADKMAAALAANPNFDAMGRDDMVEWLKEVGVVVPSVISKVNARQAIDDAVADYKAGL